MEVLPPVVRSQLIDDSLAVSRAGILNYTVTMDVIRSLENETDFLVWDAAVRGLRFIHNKMHDDESFNVSFWKYIDARMPVRLRIIIY